MLKLSIEQVCIQCWLVIGFIQTAFNKKPRCEPQSSCHLFPRAGDVARSSPIRQQIKRCETYRCCGEQARMHRHKPMPTTFHKPRDFSGCVVGSAVSLWLSLRLSWTGSRRLEGLVLRPVHTSRHSLVQPGAANSNRKQPR